MIIKFTTLLLNLFSVSQRINQAGLMRIIWIYCSNLGCRIKLHPYFYYLVAEQQQFGLVDDPSSYSPHSIFDILAFNTIFFHQIFVLDCFNQIIPALSPKNITLAHLHTLQTPQYLFLQLQINLMTTKQSHSNPPPKQAKIKKEATKKQTIQTKVSHTFTIDCSKPVEDKVFNTTNFAEYLRQRIKIAGRTGHLGESVRVGNDEKKVTVKADIAFSKRYLKYLTKKYLKRHSLREFLYVVAANKASYQIKYFNIQQDAADQE